MTTTDTDALAERIARALRQATDDGADRTEDYAAAVLPIVEEYARAVAKAAWDEAASHAESKSWLTNFRADDLRTANPYRETGDQT